MWAKPEEVPRLIALRRAALEALAGQAAFRASIGVELELHCPLRAARGVGDLDNFITGVCDGLMAAGPRSRMDPRWDAADVGDIHPSKTVAMEDDSAVVSITARNIADAPTPWYRVSLEGE